MKKIILFIVLIGLTQLSFAQKTKAKATPKATTTSVSKKQEVTESKSEVVSSSRTKSLGMGFGKGDFFISGTIGYTSKDNGTSDTSTIAVLPSLGYFINDNVALVGTIGFENTDNGTTSSDEFIIGAAARYYLSPKKQFSLYGQGGIDFRSGDNANSFGLGVKPGLNYFVSERFSLDATFGEIGFRNTSFDGGGSTSDFNFGLDMRSIGLGLNYKF